MTTSFWIVDTFNKKAFYGYPSAVFFVDNFDNEELMQLTSMEINTPESIFVKELPHGDFEVMCFGPNSKGMNFGSGLFAVAEVVRNKSEKKLKPFNMICSDRIFPVSIDDDGEIKIRFSSTELNKVTMPSSLHNAIGGALIVSIAECNEDLIVEIRSPKKMFNLIPSMDILKTIDYKTFILTADTHYETDLDYDFCARVFAPNLGIFNEIMSPIAHAKLASYWAARIGKNELIGHQESDFKNGYTKILYGEEYTYVSGKCAISTTGEMC